MWRFARRAADRLLCLTLLVEIPGKPILLQVLPRSTHIGDFAANLG